jgi:hypothetical protein
LAAALAGVVFLVGCDLGEDVGGGLVKLVEVVLLRGGFLRLLVASASTARWTYQNRRLVGLDNLRLGVAPNEGIPHLVAPRRLVFLDDNEERTVPARHAVWLFVAEDEVLEIIVLVAAVLVGVGQQGRVELATLVGGGSYVHL